jgi:SAM-dependent MidA family methyltransferase
VTGAASASDALAESIREMIRARGPISFAEFMAQALYHPRLGYYSSGRCAIGRRGDYFTSVSVGPLFGMLLAAQFAEIWEKLDRPREFTIVEQGAHDGVFAHDVLRTLAERSAECFADLRYIVIEPFPILRERQRETLKRFAAKMEWRETVAEVPPFCGVHFSNEFLDALPVHRLRASGAPNEREWRELFVAENANSFDFVEKKLSNEKLRAQIANLPPAPNDDYETEVNLAALDWIRALAPKLDRGVIITIDYGWSRAEFYAPARARGTLQSYAAHRALASPFEKIGESDITAHIEWTSLAEHAENCGLTIAGFTDQHHFLTGLLAANPETAALATKQARALQTLLHPEFLGTRFQVLGLTKNCAAGDSLGGFKFARDPRKDLGLARDAD